MTATSTTAALVTTTATVTSTDGGDELIEGDGEVEGEGNDEGVTRCVCDDPGPFNLVFGGKQPRRVKWGHRALTTFSSDATGLMIQCDSCNAWQHAKCLGIPQNQVPDVYYCEQCRPDLHVELLKSVYLLAPSLISPLINLAMKPRSLQRRSSTRTQRQTTHDDPLSPPSTDSPHSTSPKPQPPAKRRNTMNSSRDMAYEEALKLSLASLEGDANGGNGRRKRKRLVEVEIDFHERWVLSVEASFHVSLIMIHAKAPRNENDPKMTLPRIIPQSTLKIRRLRHLTRTGRVKVVGIRLDEVDAVLERRKIFRWMVNLMVRPLPFVDISTTADAIYNTAPNSKPNNRHPNQYTYARGQGTNPSGPSTSKAAPAKGRNANAPPSQQSHEHGTRRNPNHNPPSPPSPSPPPSSYQIPDHLSHLSPLLPSLTPKGVEIRGVVEKGVKIRWPGKRTTIGEMRRRVRGMMEFVGRAQVEVGEKERRVEALRKGIEEIEADRREKEEREREEGEMKVDVDVDVDVEEKKEVDVPPPTSPLTPPPPSSPPTPAAPPLLPTLSYSSTASTSSSNQSNLTTTTQLLDSLTRELIQFQEKFGAGKELGVHKVYRASRNAGRSTRAATMAGGDE
jgi:hypothetical protein